MTNEHLRPLLDSERDMHLFFRVAELLARGDVPENVASVLRKGRLTALQKPGGGVRGTVAGDVIRRLVARTVAQQLGKAVEHATAPFQYALSTRAGCECVAHALQAVSDLNPEATVVSIDGISAYDLISRRAMLSGLAGVEGGAKVLPFVNLFYGSPSTYWWEDAMGTVHEVHQGEGGVQGDAMMPLLFSLGQHPALEAVNRQLRAGELLFAFLDGVYVVCSPARVGEWFTHCSKMHSGGTPASKCTLEKRRCGTAPVLGQRRAISWKDEPSWWRSVPRSGEEATKQARLSRGSRSWERRSGTQISSRTSCSTCGNTNRRCWTAYL